MFFGWGYKGVSKVPVLGKVPKVPFTSRKCSVTWSLGSFSGVEISSKNSFKMSSITYLVFTLTFSLFSPKLFEIFPKVSVNFDEKES